MPRYCSASRGAELRLRDVAERVGITERAVQRIVSDLEGGGYLSRVREGRRNRYEVHADRPFRHPVTAHRDVSLLLDLFVGASLPRPSRAGETGRDPSMKAPSPAQAACSTPSGKSLRK